MRAGTSQSGKSVSARTAICARLLFVALHRLVARELPFVSAVAVSAVPLFCRLGLRTS